MSRNARVDILGVPDSAGAYCVGIEQAPAALREAGLFGALTDAGRVVHDHGDLTLRRWAPDRENRFLQNLGSEVEAMSELASAASRLLSVDSQLLVIGGSCLVALGMCAAVTGWGERPRLIYIDRHLDLNTSHSTSEGSLSWMGMAHALALEGAAPQLTEMTGHAPLLRNSDLVYLGVDLAQGTDWERSHVEKLRLNVVTQEQMCTAPSRAAATARSLLAAGPFIVHLDVDVLDFIDAPIAENVNGRNSGPTIKQLEQALVVLLQDRDCLALSIGQLNPAHAASDLTALPRLVAALASALRPGR
jgi:arginase